MTYYIIKGDIHGIQEFIFNIKSKKAARALKARSYHIEMLGWLAEEKVKQTFDESTLIYNGGGNFYLKVPQSSWDNNKFENLQADILNELPKHGTLSITLSYIEYDDSDQSSYGEKIEELNTKANRSKLNRYASAKDPISYFTPFPNQKKDDQLLFADFTDELVRKKYRDIRASEKDTSVIAQLFGNQIKLYEKDPKTRSTKPLHNQIPLWRSDEEINKHKKFTEERIKTDPEFNPPKRNGIVEFEYLSHFAYLRTGTDKLGILKLDVDNLGALFIKVGNEKNNNTLSEYFTKFFTTELDQLLNEKFEYKCRALTQGKEKEPQKKEVGDITSREGKITIKYYEYANDANSVFRENLYIVFAGGDDSFIIGGWDAVIEFAIRLHKKFSEFETTFRKKEFNFLTNPITLSAAVIVVDPHYPVVKFAELVEEELRKAKTHNSNIKKINFSDASGKPLKDSVAFLGQVFRWKDLIEEVVNVKVRMVEMIVKYDAPKAFVQRIIQSFENSDTDYWLNMTEKKPFDPALLWRFPYHFRDMKKELYFRQHFYKDFFGDPTDGKLGGYYRTYIWDYFESNKQTSQVLPTAARWTEFLTREKQIENE